METEKLDKWAELLLDTGKKNNLVNFKNTKDTTVEVVYPDFSTIFEKVSNNATFEIYDSKLQINVDDIEANEKPKKLSKAEYTEKYGNKIRKQNQILLYSEYINPTTAIKNINKKARSAIDETGVNIAYMAFGFIHWKDSESTNTWLDAPILLAPVSIQNESSLEPCYIKVTEDDIVLNPTFSFKLQTAYGIKLPDYNDEAIDDYIAKIKELVSKLKWEVSTECKIGIFSFLKINMYRDIMDNASMIVRNKNVKALLGETEETSAVCETVESDSDNSVKSDNLAELNNVVDADSSQAEAIKMAREGKSFVLQGPPGTGKSQTITNIIAQCLSDGKKILFVSEKLAALNVVYDKLKQAGLSEFCLELHSHKANKGDVIKELCHTLRMNKSTVSSRAAQETALKEKAQKQLDGYAEELHKKQEVINKSLYELYEAISACRKARTVDYVISDLKSKGEDFISEVEDSLMEYVEYTSSIGYDYRTNVWYGYKNPDTTYQGTVEVKNDLKEFKRILKTADDVAKEISIRYGIECKSLNEMKAYAKFFELVSKSDTLTPVLLDKEKLEYVDATSYKLENLSENIRFTKETLSLTYDDDVYNIDARTVYKKLARRYSGWMSRLLSRGYKTIRNDLRLAKKNGKKVRYKEALKIVGSVKSYQEMNDEFKVIEGTLDNCFGNVYKGIETAWSTVHNDLNVLKEIFESVCNFGKIAEMNQKPYTSEHETFEKIASILVPTFENGKDVIDRINKVFDHNEYDICGVPIEDDIEKCENCYANIDKIDNWYRFSVLVDKLKELGMIDFVDEMIERRIPAAEILGIYKKAFYSQWIDCIIHETPIFTQLTRVPHDKAVELFAKKDELQFEINKAKIKAELSATRPELDMVASGSAISVLLREGEKKRKQKGIRALLSEIPDLVQLLKPCFLMSPLSVSTFLSPETEFDVVVFDEASQIFPQDAIGAIYRGKQLIVVGDSKQMPPSNFFNAVAEIDEGEDDDDINTDINDFESILDLCATAFPQLRLKWHYRSRYEQLISFSNKNFYDNDLVTFPSSQTDKSGIGVDYYHVDGVYDHRSKNNRNEAEFIVDLIYKNIEEHPERSLGVVAFSISQQDIIEKLLAKRRLSEKDKEYFFRTDKKEPFFIKNLETVQGDERDTIIFSVGYAKDSQGKLLYNFGPINKVGGERRLNVAVTRAKINVQLVSSLHYTDIDLNKTGATGARLLREYLDFAENGAVSFERIDDENGFGKNEYEVEEEICEFLRSKGFEVDTKVGCSSLRIDIALKLPNSPDYVLAIECDGDSFRTSKNTRDRERLRKNVLERMGWKYYRIWTTDWFKNKRVEQEQLLQVATEAVNSAMAGKFEIKEEEPEEEVFEVISEQKRFEFPKYRMANIPELRRKYEKDFQEFVLAVLKIEAPLSEDWFMKRILFMFNQNKLTKAFINEYNDKMYDCAKKGIQRIDGFLYLEGKRDFVLRAPSEDVIREIKQISLEELASGLMEIIKRNITVDKNGLYKTLIQQLGYSRMGEAIYDRLERAIKLIKNEIKVEGEMISLQ